MPDGKLETYEVGDGRHLPVLREMEPPCDQCPRGGPQNEKRYRLSDRNWQAYSLWSKIKATRGTYLLHPKIASCPLFAKVMCRIEQTVEAALDAARAAAIKRAREEAKGKP